MERLLFLIAVCLLSISLYPDGVQAQNKTTGQANYYITSKDGTRLYVQEFGQGPPVILLAGGPGLNPIYLKPVWEHLDKSYRFIVLNQRGTGKSVVHVVDSASMTMDNYVYDLEALRRHLGLQKIVLAGHSWGGMLAMLYLSRKPQHVEKLVLIDPGGLEESFDKIFEANLHERLTASDLALIRKEDSLHISHLPGGYPGFFYHRQRALATRPSAAEASQLVGQPGVFKFTANSYFTGSDAMIKALKKVKNVPVILIRGKQDPIPQSVALKIKSVLPQTQIHFIDHCGHFPWLEDPRQVKEFYFLFRKALSGYPTRLKDWQQVTGLDSLVRKGSLQ